MLPICLHTLLLSFTCLHTGFGSYVKIEASTDIVYGRDDMLIQCFPINLFSKDSIYSITISKVVNGESDGIVQIETDTQMPPHFFKVLWFSYEMKNKANISLSSLIPTSSAKLVLYVQASNVSCTDEGVYQCEIKVSNAQHGVDSTQINIQVVDVTFDIKDVTENSKPYYNISDIVTLKCMAFFKTPKCMRWCIQNSQDAEYEEHLTNNVTFSSIIFNGCQFSQYSILRYKVVPGETSIRFRCELMAEEACGSPAIPHANVTINISDAQLVDASASSVIKYMKQELHLQCKSRLLRQNDLIIGIILRKLMSKVAVPIVEGIFNTSTRNTSVVIHNKLFFDRRLMLFIDIVPNLYALLQINISSKEVMCSDSGTYRCDLLLSQNIYSQIAPTVTIDSPDFYVDTIVSPVVVLGRDVLKITCRALFFGERDTISKIILSKITDTEITKLVSVELDLTGGQVGSVWRWHDIYLKARIKHFMGWVFPANDANLDIEILETSVLCTDAGSYMCEVITADGTTSHKKAEVNISATISETFPIQEQGCVGRSDDKTNNSKITLKCIVKTETAFQKPIWCVKTDNQSQFVPYKDDKNIFYGIYERNSCQYNTYTILQYSLPQSETDTFFICVVSRSECEISLKNHIHVVQNKPGIHCYKDVLVSRGKDNLNQGYITAVTIVVLLTVISGSFFIYKIVKDRDSVCAFFRKPLRLIFSYETKNRRSPEENDNRINDERSLNESNVFYDIQMT